MSKHTLCPVKKKIFSSLPRKLSGTAVKKYLPTIQLRFPKFLNIASDHASFLTFPFLSNNPRPLCSAVHRKGKLGHGHTCQHFPADLATSSRSFTSNIVHDPMINNNLKIKAILTKQIKYKYVQGQWLFSFLSNMAFNTFLKAKF